MISLVVSTIGRADELERLLSALSSQTFQDFEVVIVDQNPDERLNGVISRNEHLEIQHIRSEKGLSLGRNVGLQAVRGEIIAIPDDDCWYPRDLLANVNTWFEEHAQFSILFTAVLDENGLQQGPKRRSVVACECDRDTVWHCGISFNAFLRRSVVESVGQFDERIGAGCPTIFKSGEETDYFLRAMDKGKRAWYEPSLSVFHPSLRDHARVLMQAYPYALGTGFVLRKHRCSCRKLFADFLVWSFGGGLVSLCRCNFHVARVRFMRGWGQLLGYILAGRLLQGDADKTGVHS